MRYPQNELSQDPFITTVPAVCVNKRVSQTPPPQWHAIGQTVSCGRSQAEHAQWCIRDGWEGEVFALPGDDTVICCCAPLLPEQPGLSLLRDRPGDSSTLPPSLPPFFSLPLSPCLKKTNLRSLLLLYSYLLIHVICFSLSSCYIVSCFLPFFSL